MVNQQEYLIKLSMIQQEAQQLQEKMQVIDQQIQEMQAIRASLKEIKEKGNNEMLANLGKGIFIKTEIKEKDLFVNVGKEILVKKNIQETISILEDQVEKLIQGKETVMDRIEEIQGEMQNLIIEAQKEKKDVKNIEEEK